MEGATGAAVGTGVVPSRAVWDTAVRVRPATGARVAVAGPVADWAPRVVDSVPSRGAEVDPAVGTRVSGVAALRTVGLGAVLSSAGLVRPPTDAGVAALAATRPAGDAVPERKVSTDLLTRSCCVSNETRAVPSRRAVTAALRWFCRAAARSDPDAATIWPWLARYGTTGSGPRIAVACRNSPVRIALGVCRELLPRSRVST